MLQATSPSQRKFLESTRAEVSKIAKRTRAQNQKRFSIDAHTMFRAESMPGQSIVANYSSCWLPNLLSQCVLLKDACLKYISNQLSASFSNELVQRYSRQKNLIPPSNHSAYLPPSQALVIFSVFSRCIQFISQCQLWFKLGLDLIPINVFEKLNKVQDMLNLSLALR